MKPAPILSFICLVVMIGVTGCRAPATNTIVARVQRPDGHLSAVLVERELKAALSSNEFFLILVPHTENIGEAIAGNDIGDRAALVATRSDKVTLQWLDNSTLIVECNSCGLESIDINKRMDRIAQVDVVYRGFPPGTAYGR